MKKQIIFLLVSVLLIGTISAITTSMTNRFIDLNEAKQYAETYKNNLNESIEQFKAAEQIELNKLILKYEHTTDKVCEYNHDTYEFLCYICYEMIYPVKTKGCVYLSENSNQVEDDRIIDEHIRNSLKVPYPLEDIDIAIRNEKGRILDKK